MKKLSILAVIALVAVAFTMMPDSAFASTAGSQLKEDLVDMLKGNIGTLAGLGISLLGLYTWIVKQETWGIMIVLGGALITAFPSAFDQVRDGVANAFTGVTKSSTNAN